MEGSKIWASRPLMVGDSSLMPRSPSYQDWTRLRSQMEGPEVIRPSPENQLFHVMSPGDLAIIDVRRNTPTLAEVNDFTGTAYSTISLSDKLIQSSGKKSPAATIYSAIKKTLFDQMTSQNGLSSDARTLVKRRWGWISLYSSRRWDNSLSLMSGPK